MEKWWRGSFQTAFLTGLAEIRSHKVRSSLSLFAVSISVASLIYTFIQTEGAAQAIKKSAELIGPGPLEISQKRGTGEKKTASIPLSYKDAVAVRNTFPDLYMVSPVKTEWGRKVFYKGRELRETMLFGVTPEWAKREWVYTQRGRFINAEDILYAKRVCVLIEEGGWINKPFWLSFWGEEEGALKMSHFLKHEQMLGKSIMIDGHSMTVVGIIKEPPKDKDPRWFSGYWGAERVILPLTTLNYYMGDAGGYVDEIRVDTGNEKTLPFFKREITRLLKFRHRGEENFTIRDYREAIQQHMQESSKHYMSILVMGIICLVGGGVGIMNVTLATIYSRIKEIGIRRALGASRRDILLQFVVEAALLGFFGGIVGIILGQAGVYFFLKALRWVDLAALSPFHYLTALLISSGTGFIFSVWPAWQAAKLDPVEALRYE